jgi:hypothetical protein
VTHQINGPDHGTVTMRHGSAARNLPSPRTGRSRGRRRESHPRRQRSSTSRDDGDSGPGEPAAPPRTACDTFAAVSTEARS